MTKQEKLMEGIAKLTEDRFRISAENAGLTWDRSFNYMMASDILSYLQSQGVVIKVDWKRELNKTIYPEDIISQDDLLSGRVVAVEPLTEGSD